MRARSPRTSTRLPAARISWGAGKAAVALETHGHGSLREATMALVDATTQCNDHPRRWERLVRELTNGAANRSASFAKTVPAGLPLFTCTLDFRGTFVTSPALPSKHEALMKAVEIAGERKLIPTDAAGGAKPADADRPEHRVKLAQCEQAIRARFPALLVTPPRPMKIGTFKQVLEAVSPPLSRHDVSYVLTRHTSSRTYLEALAAGGDRYDAEGQPAGSVSDAHRKHAQLVLDAIPNGPQGLMRKGAQQMYRSKLLKLYEASKLSEDKAFA